LRYFACRLDFGATLLPKFPGHSSTTDYNLGLHFRDRLRTSGLASQAARFTAFAPVFRLCSHSTGAELLCSPTPPEVCRPSGGVIAGVRFTRDYHPRHLPPMVFLRPPTVCTSRRLTCSVSYRHHLWDSKNTTRCCAPRIPDRSIQRTVPSGTTRLGHDQLPEGKRSRNCCSLVTRHKAHNEVIVLSHLLCCSPDFLQAVRRKSATPSSS
jgi:hypothetical protein